MSARSILFGLFSAGLLLGALSGSASAAEGVVIPAARIPAAARATLIAEIDALKRTNPGAFSALAAKRKLLPDLDAQKRGRLAPLTPMLKAMGPTGLFPMLAELAVEANARGDLTDTAWLAWRVGLLEAVGSLHDARSEATLAAILDGPETDFAVMKAAAEALGRVGTDSAASKLVALSRAAGPKQKAVLAGMGDCRRTKTTEALAKALAARPDEETAKLLFRSLGNAGSAWAWKTPVVAASGEEAAVRKAAAKALVSGFIAYAGVRQLASDAILVVDDPSTPALIAAAKKRADAALWAELDKLEARFAQNPIH